MEYQIKRKVNNRTIYIAKEIFKSSPFMTYENWKVKMLNIYGDGIFEDLDLIWNTINNIKSDTEKIDKGKYITNYLTVIYNNITKIDYKKLRLYIKRNLLQLIIIFLLLFIILRNEIFNCANSKGVRFKPYYNYRYDSY